MRVHEIAKATGQKSGDVAAGLGLDGEAVHMRDVDDDVANAYIKDVGATAESKQVKFWSAKRSHFLPSAKEEERGDIQFDDWGYWTADDSPESAWLQLTEIRDRLGIMKIIDAPYKVVEAAVEFQQFLLSQIYTGQSQQDGPSREGIKRVCAIMTDEELSKLSTADRNNPKRLVKAVTAIKSMNTETFSVEV